MLPQYYHFTKCIFHPLGVVGAVNQKTSWGFISLPFGEYHMVNSGIGKTDFSSLSNTTNILGYKDISILHFHFL